MDKLTDKAVILLRELVLYETKYGKSEFGIFIDSKNNHKLIVKSQHELYEFVFNKLSRDEIVDALDELNHMYLNYTVNMHYFIRLTDEGRRVSRNLIAL